MEMTDMKENDVKSENEKELYEKWENGNKIDA